VSIGRREENFPESGIAHAMFGAQDWEKLRMFSPWRIIQFFQAAAIPGIPLRRREESKMHMPARAAARQAKH